MKQLILINTHFVALSVLLECCRFDDFFAQQVEKGFHHVNLQILPQSRVLNAVPGLLTGFLERPETKNQQCKVRHP